MQQFEGENLLEQQNEPGEYLEIPQREDIVATQAK